MLPHASTAFLSALAALVAGLWLHAMTTKKWDRTEAILVSGFSAIMGFGLSLVLCGWLCRDEDGSALVIGLCCLGGLIGFNPQALRRVAKQLPVLKTMVVDDESRTSVEPRPKKPDSDAARAFREP